MKNAFGLPLLSPALRAVQRGVPKIQPLIVMHLKHDIFAVI